MTNFAECTTFSMAGRVGNFNKILTKQALTHILCLEQIDPIFWDKNSEYSSG